jgi:hypothetical protein
MKQKRIKTGVVVEGVDMQTYRSIGDPHHVTGRTFRSVDEAFKGANYACAIEKHKPDYLHAFEWFCELFMFFLLVGSAMTLPIVLFMWLSK